MYQLVGFSLESWGWHLDPPWEDPTCQLQVFSLELIVFLSRYFQFSPAWESGTSIELLLAYAESACSFEKRPSLSGADLEKDAPSAPSVQKPPIGTWLDWQVASLAPFSSEM